MKIKPFYYQIKYYIILTFILSLFPGVLYSFPKPVIDSLPQIIIKNIVIDGNNKTKRKTILKYLKIDTGDVYDSTLIDTAEKRVHASGLFHRTKIYPIINRERATLLITVREKQYFVISNIGGAYYNTRYGKPTERIWFQGVGTLSFNNFRGWNERLDVSVSLLRRRYIGLSWYKPFISTPYFIRLGSVVGSYPFVNAPWHVKIFNSSSTTFGRKIGEHSRISSSLRGKYSRYKWMGDDGELKANGKVVTDKNIIRDISNNPDLPELKRDFDTNFVVDGINYEWDGFSTWKLNEYEKPVKELFLSLGWVTDKRNKKFNPKKGFYYSILALTNIWPYKDFNLKKEEFRYLQMSGDFRFYHRGIWQSNIIAYRIRPLLRFFGKGNTFSGIYLGDELLRGYRSGQFGNWTYNNRILFSWEYRFPIFKLPNLRFPWLAWYDQNLDNLSIRVDGACIFDYGYIWKDLLGPLHPKLNHENVAGAGLGLRFMFPKMQRAISADIVFPVFSENSYKNLWKPSYYLYLDLPF